MRSILLLLSTLIALHASPITLTPEQEKDWQLHTEQPKMATELPLGEFMAEVVTPPHYLYAVTLPFEAQVKSIDVAPFQQVTQGETLATVSSQTWLQAQQSFIEDSIAYQYQNRETERKNKLCSEEIIPQKDCLEAKSERERLYAKLTTSEALLIAYGATPETVNRLSQTSRIEPTLPILSPDNGIITELSIHTGKSITSDTPLMMIQKEGALWLEAAIPVKQAAQLTKGQTVMIALNGERFESQVLLHAPTVNPLNQTQTVRFKLPKEKTFLSGLKERAMLYIQTSVLQVAKASVISQERQNIVFVKTAAGYEPTLISIVGEDSSSYYLNDQPALHQPIVTSSVAILKSMMESGNE